MFLWGEYMVYVGTLEKNPGLGNGYFILDPQKGESPIKSAGYPCERQWKQQNGSVVWIEDKFGERLSADVPNNSKPIVQADFE